VLPLFRTMSVFWALGHTCCAVSSHPCPPSLVMWFSMQIIFPNPPNRQSKGKTNKQPTNRARQSRNQQNGLWQNRSIPRQAVSPFQYRSNAVDQVFRYQGTQSTILVNTSTVTGTPFGTAFNLNALSAATTLTSLFDQYRITRIQVRLFFPFTQTPESAIEQAVWTSAIDLDDANTSIASNNFLLTRPGAVCTTLFEDHFHSFQPRVAVATYNGAFTAYASPDNNLWLDCAYPTVQYYGLKLFVEPTQVVLAVRALVTFDVEFRGITLA
jgi:hypothetical protein